MATATATRIVGTPRTFSVPDRPSEHLENEMAKKQYHNRADLAVAMGRKKITTAIATLMSKVRKAPFGDTSQPTGYECDVDMLSRIRRCRSSIRYGQGLLNYAKKNARSLKAGMTKTQWTQHRRIILAFEDLEVAITKICSKYKVS